MMNNKTSATSRQMLLAIVVAALFSIVAVDCACQASVNGAASVLEESAHSASFYGNSYPDFEVANNVAIYVDSTPLLQAKQLSALGYTFNAAIDDAKFLDELSAEASHFHYNTGIDATLFVIDSGKVYFCNGSQIQQWNLATGAFISAVSITGAEWNKCSVRSIDASGNIIVTYMYEVLAQPRFTGAASVKLDGTLNWQTRLTRTFFTEGDTIATQAYADPNSVAVIVATYNAGNPPSNELHLLNFVDGSFRFKTFVTSSFSLPRKYLAHFPANLLVVERSAGMYTGINTATGTALWNYKDLAVGGYPPYGFPKMPSIAYMKSTMVIKGVGVDPANGKAFYFAAANDGSVVDAVSENLFVQASSYNGFYIFDEWAAGGSGLGESTYMTIYRFGFDNSNIYYLASISANWAIKKIPILCAASATTPPARCGRRLYLDGGYSNPADGFEDRKMFPVPYSFEGMLYQVTGNRSIPEVVAISKIDTLGNSIAGWDVSFAAYQVIGTQEILHISGDHLLLADGKVISRVDGSVIYTITLPTTWFAGNGKIVVMDGGNVALKTFATGTDIFSVSTATALSECANADEGVLGTNVVLSGQNSTFACFVVLDGASGSVITSYTSPSLSLQSTAVYYMDVTGQNIVAYDLATSSQRFSTSKNSFTPCVGQTMIVNGSDANVVFAVCGMVVVAVDTTWGDFAWYEAPAPNTYGTVSVVAGTNYFALIQDSSMAVFKSETGARVGKWARNYDGAFNLKWIGPSLLMFFDGSLIEFEVNCTSSPSLPVGPVVLTYPNNLASALSSSGALIGSNLRLLGSAGANILTPTVGCVASTIYANDGTYAYSISVSGEPTGSSMILWSADYSFCGTDGTIYSYVNSTGTFSRHVSATLATTWSISLTDAKLNNFSFCTDSSSNIALFYEQTGTSTLIIPNTADGSVTSREFNLYTGGTDRWPTLGKACSGSNVYVSIDDALTKFDMSTAAQVLQKTSTNCRPISASSTTVFCLGAHGDLTAYDASTLAMKWTAYILDPFVSNPDAKLLSSTADVEGAYVNGYVFVCWRVTNGQPYTLIQFASIAIDAATGVMVYHQRSKKSGMTCGFTPVANDAFDDAFFNYYTTDSSYSPGVLALSHDTVVSKSFLSSGDITVATSESPVAFVTFCSAGSHYLVGVTHTGSVKWSTSVVSAESCSSNFAVDDADALNGWIWFDGNARIFGKATGTIVNTDAAVGSVFTIAGSIATNSVVIFDSTSVIYKTLSGSTLTQVWTVSITGTVESVFVVGSNSVVVSTVTGGTVFLSSVDGSIVHTASVYLGGVEGTNFFASNANRGYSKPKVQWDEYPYPAFVQDPARFGVRIDIVGLKSTAVLPKPCDTVVADTDYYACYDKETRQLTGYDRTTGDKRWTRMFPRLDSVTILYDYFVVAWASWTDDDSTVRSGQIEFIHQQHGFTGYTKIEASAGSPIKLFVLLTATGAHLTAGWPSGDGYVSSIMNFGSTIVPTTTAAPTTLAATTTTAPPAATQPPSTTTLPTSTAPPGYTNPPSTVPPPTTSLPPGYTNPPSTAPPPTTSLPPYPPATSGETAAPTPEPTTCSSTSATPCPDCLCNFNGRGYRVGRNCFCECFEGFDGTTCNSCAAGYFTTDTGCSPCVVSRGNNALVGISGVRLDLPIVVSNSPQCHGVKVELTSKRVQRGTTVYDYYYYWWNWFTSTSGSVATQTIYLDYTSGATAFVTTPTCQANSESEVLVRFNDAATYKTLYRIQCLIPPKVAPSSSQPTSIHLWYQATQTVTLRNTLMFVYSLMGSTSQSAITVTISVSSLKASAALDVGPGFTSFQSVQHALNRIASDDASLHYPAQTTAASLDGCTLVESTGAYVQSKGVVVVVGDFSPSYCSPVQQAAGINALREMMTKTDVVIINEALQGTAMQEVSTVTIGFPENHVVQTNEVINKYHIYRFIRLTEACSTTATSVTSYPERIDVTVMHDSVLYFHGRCDIAKCCAWGYCSDDIVSEGHGCRLPLIPRTGEANVVLYTSNGDEITTDTIIYTKWQDIWTWNPTDGNDGNLSLTVYHYRPREVCWTLRCVTDRMNVYALADMPVYAAAECVNDNTTYSPYNAPYHWFTPYGKDSWWYSSTKVNINRPLPSQETHQCLTLLLHYDDKPQEMLWPLHRPFTPPTPPTTDECCTPDALTPMRISKRLNELGYLGSDKNALPVSDTSSTDLKYATQLFNAVLGGAKPDTSVSISIAQGSCFCSSAAEYSRWVDFCTFSGGIGEYFKMTGDTDSDGFTYIKTKKTCKDNFKRRYTTSAVANFAVSACQTVTNKLLRGHSGYRQNLCDIRAFSPFAYTGETSPTEYGNEVTFRFPNNLQGYSDEYLELDESQSWKKVIKGEEARYLYLQELLSALPTSGLSLTAVELDTKATAMQSAIEKYFAANGLSSVTVSFNSKLMKRDLRLIFKPKWIVNCETPASSCIGIPPRYPEIAEAFGGVVNGRIPPQSSAFNTPADTLAYCTIWNEKDQADSTVLSRITESENHYPCPATVMDVMPAEMWRMWGWGTTSWFGETLGSNEHECWMAWPRNNRRFSKRCCYDIAQNIFLSDYPSHVRASEGFYFWPDYMTEAIMGEVTDYHPERTCCLAASATDETCNLYRSQRPVGTFVNSPFDFKWTVPVPRAWGYGDPYCRTFDDFGFECNFYGEALWASCGNLKIHVIAKPPAAELKATAIYSVAVQEGNSTVLIVRNASVNSTQIFVDGKQITTDYVSTQFSVFFTNDTNTNNANYRIINPTESEVMIEDLPSFLSLAVAFEKACVGKAKGLLGNFDGNKNNDLVSRSGSVTLDPTTATSSEIYDKIVKSYVIASSSESLFPPPLVQAPSTYGPKFADKATVDDCPAMCQKDVGCCLDAQVAGIEFAKSSLVAAKVANVSTETIPKLGANWPPQFKNVVGEIVIVSGERVVITIEGSDSDGIESFLVNLCESGGASCTVVYSAGKTTATVTVTIPSVSQLTVVKFEMTDMKKATSRGVVQVKVTQRSTTSTSSAMGFAVKWWMYAAGAAVLLLLIALFYFACKKKDNKKNEGKRYEDVDEEISPKDTIDGVSQLDKSDIEGGTTLKVANDTSSPEGSLRKSDSWASPRQLLRQNTIDKDHQIAEAAEVSSVGDDENEMNTVRRPSGIYLEGLGSPKSSFKVHSPHMANVPEEELDTYDDPDL